VRVLCAYFYYDADDENEDDYDDNDDDDWGRDLSTRVRASYFSVYIHNDAVVCAFEPHGGR